MTLPLYQHISDDLKQKIVSGYFKVGDQLPTEKELSESYSVSRITAKRCSMIRLHLSVACSFRSAR